MRSAVFNGALGGMEERSGERSGDFSGVILDVNVVLERSGDLSEAAICSSCKCDFFFELRTY